MNTAYHRMSTAYHRTSGLGMAEQYLHKTMLLPNYNVIRAQVKERMQALPKQISERQKPLMLVNRCCKCNFTCTEVVEECLPDNVVRQGLAQNPI